MIRDDEIERLTNYIKGLGLKVTFSSKKSEDAAAWIIDNSEIIVYKANNASKIDVVLSLVHEIGHAIHNVHEKNRKLDKKFEKALSHVEEAEEEGIDSQKRQRKIILDNEIAGTNYWHQIYKETNMKFPLWRLFASMEFDVWQYKTYYETGRFPRVKERNERWKQLKNKHKGKNYE